jgi:acrylyl-CoA reductase (NADPH)
MTNETFRALVVEQDSDGNVQASIQQPGVDALPAGDVLVAVAYSTLNYKDGLAVTGKGKIVRKYPMVPGVDFAGTVKESQHPNFKPGDQVVLNGWGVGERHWGGYAQLARVKGEWLMPLPEGLTPQQAMGIGTAGYTAMLCVLALEENGLKPGGRPVVVTGASGGVGSFAVAILGKRGYEVAAVTGRTELHDYLRSIGASQILSREDVATSKPLESERWDGAVDAVGGNVLAGLFPAMAYESSVAACGLAGGSSLETTVFPFILRGVRLLGVESVMCPMERRLAAWHGLARDIDAAMLERIMETVALEDVLTLGNDILKGQVRGRVVVDVNR